MTVEQLQKAQELVVDLTELTKKQHELVMEIMDKLNEYADWQLEEVKKIRNEANK